MRFAAASASLLALGPVPVLHKLDLAYEPGGNGRLQGNEVIEFRNDSAAPLERVTLRLWANGPDGCRPRRITVTIEAPAAAEPERVRCSALPVRLGEPVAPGASSSLALSFSVRGRRARERFGRSQGVRLFGNTIPLLAVTDDDGSTRLPRHTSFAESFYSLTSAWEATLRLPAGQRAATTGAVLDERVEGGQRTLEVATPQARDFGLAFGRWLTLSGGAAGSSVRVHAQSRRSGRRMLRVARRSLRRFSARFGAYGSPELEVVELAEGYGMEYPELVFSADDDYVVSHEVAHQWWYSLVGNDQYAEPWLDESFATYSAATVAGTLSYCRRRAPFAWLDPPFRRMRLDRGMGFWARRDRAYQLVVYDTGACVLRWLERRIGRRRMTAFLRLLVSRHRHGVVTEADVLAALEEAAPGLDMKRFRRAAHISG